MQNKILLMLCDLFARNKTLVQRDKVKLKKYQSYITTFLFNSIKVKMYKIIQH